MNGLVIFSKISRSAAWSVQPLTLSLYQQISFLHNVFLKHLQRKRDVRPILFLNEKDFAKRSPADNLQKDKITFANFTSWLQHINNLALIIPVLGR